MHTRIAMLVLTVALLTVACGSGGGATTGPSQPATGDQASSGQPAGSPAPAGNGTADCAAIKAAAQDLLMVQLLAQLRTPDVVAAIKSKQVGNLDLDRFLASMHALHALDGHASPLGDPKAAITTYEEAAKAAQELFATDPITQAAIEAYDQKIGTVGEFIGHQVAISAAMGAAGC